MSSSPSQLPGRRSPDGPAPPPAAWLPFAVLGAVFFISQLFAAALFAVVRTAQPDLSVTRPPDGFTLAATLILELILVSAACIALFAVQGRVTPADFGLRRVDPRRALRVAAALYAAFWALSILLVAVFGQPARQQVVQRLANQDSVEVLVAFAVLTCVLAPFAEEFFFRGFMFGVLARRLGPVPGALVVGVAFGLIHAPAPVVSLVALGCFGVALCAVFWRTRSVIPCMGLHALHNSISFAATKGFPWWGFLGLIAASVALVVALGTALAARGAAPAAVPAAY